MKKMSSCFTCSIKSIFEKKKFLQKKKYLVKKSSFKNIKSVEQFSLNVFLNIKKIIFEKYIDKFFELFCFIKNTNDITYNLKKSEIFFFILKEK